MMAGRSLRPSHDRPSLLSSRARLVAVAPAFFATRTSASPPAAGAKPKAAVGSATGVARSLVELPYAWTPEPVSAMPFSCRIRLLPLHCHPAPSGQDISIEAVAGTAVG